ncbi:MAG: hypothetical protein WC899_08535 [bacterium]|jgi:hypothetical protein
MTDKNKHPTTRGWKDFFFSNYLWFGVLVILLAIVIEKPVTSVAIIHRVLIDLMEAIGIAIVVASIFTIATETSHFMTKIQNILENIVVSKEFLGNIDIERKKEALKSLLIPSSEEKLIYSNIDTYYKKYINKTLDISNACVRSNYYVNCRAYLDASKKRVAVEQTMSYRLYPTSSGYKPIEGLVSDQEGLSGYQVVTVNAPTGQRKTFTPAHIDGGDRGYIKDKKFKVELGDIGKDCDHLDIELKAIEYGEDHWMMLTFQAMQPTDSFKFSLRCEDGLIIGSNDTFVFGAEFHIETNTRKDYISFSCNQWINEGTGLAVLINIPHKPIIS